MDPVDEAKDMFWSLTRKAKSASKSAVKSFKKAVGIPVGQLSEANPRYYMVISGEGALVRKEMDLESPQVYTLRFGDVVTCAEIVGRRARIIDPVVGWVSLFTSENESLFELTFPPDKRTQARTMERRFEKLKQEQARKQGDTSPIAAPTVQRVDDEPPADGVATLKSKIVFKSSASSVETPVPRLGMTLQQSKKPAVTEDLLLDFESAPESSSRLTPQRVEELDFESAPESSSRLTPERVEEFSLL